MAGTNAEGLQGLYFRLTRLVKARPCVICGESPSEFAHVEGVAGKGRATLRPRQGLSLLYGLPLCAEHHRTAPDSFHGLGQVGFAERHWGGETHLLALATRETLTALAALLLDPLQETP